MANYAALNTSNTAAAAGDFVAIATAREHVTNWQPHVDDVIIHHLQRIFGLNERGSIQRYCLYITCIG